MRDRPEDIAPLAQHFLGLARRDFNREVEGFASDALAALRRHRWPGNVRELMSVVRRAVVVGDGPWIEAATLIGLDAAADMRPVPVAVRPGSPEERATLLATLERTNENVTSTADALSVSRVTLYPHAAPPRDRAETRPGRTPDRPPPAARALSVAPRTRRRGPSGLLWCVG